MRISKTSFLLILFSLTFCLFTSYLSCEKDFSGIKILQTPDTTSHHVDWKEFTFGYRNSILNDVCIINENDIWAVGEIYVQDSNGTDIRYNAIHWNTQQWELKRIPFIGPCSSVDYPPIQAIWAFSSNHILFTNGGAIAVQNGTTTYLDCGMNALLDGAIKKIFALDPSNVYAVGYQGIIVYYNGSSWQKQESGTDVDLTDVWGSPDGSVVWACGWDDFKPTVLLRKYDGGNWELIYNDLDNLFHFRPDSLSGAIFSVWTDKATSLYALTNYTLYKCNPQMPVKGEYIWEAADPYIWASRRLRGTSDNDLVAVGYEGRIWHFNGASWRLYNELVNPIDILNSVAISNDMVIAVGLRYFNGIEILGIVYLGQR